MTTRGTREIWPDIAHIALGSFVLGVLTYSGYCFHFNLSTAGFLCLIVVVLLSFWGNLTSAVATSVMAVGWLDYFFAPPIHSLRVSDPHNMLALATFLTVAVTVSYLMSRIRQEKHSSELQRREMKRLYELAQMLLALRSEEITAPRLLALFRDVFALRAVCLFESDPVSSHVEGEPRYDLAEWTRMAYFSTMDRDDPVCRVSIRCLRANGKTIGALGFEWPDHEEFTPDSLSALETAMLERMRAFRAAAEAAATAEAETLRATILDALAHTVKTPLATILAAAGGVREAGNLNSDQAEFLTVVETEASRLSNLTTRLLRMATLDREEVKPRLQKVDISGLITEELNQRSQQFIDHKILFESDRNLPDANADPELVRLAIAQLIENACKYSKPGSKVKVSTRGGSDHVAIRIRNSSYIPEEEQARIFDRYYRGKQSRNNSSGTGLGLDIARRIALAHQGALVLEESTREGSVFRLILPAYARN